MQAHRLGSDSPSNRCCRATRDAAPRQCFGSLNQRAYEMVLEGKIIGGVGSAATDLSQRLPIISREYDELRDAHPATINVYIGGPIDLKIDFKTDKMICDPPHLHRIEFVRVQFELPLGTKTKAWIYQPYGYHWGIRSEKCMVEVLIGKYLKDVAVGLPCRIHILNKGEGSSSTPRHYLREHQDRQANG